MSPTISNPKNVGLNARVVGNARVDGNAVVTGNARVDGDAWVDGDARISKPEGILTGCDRYDWTTFREKDGKTILRFGCERLELRQWTKAMQAKKCREHDKSAAEILERVVRVVRAFWRGR